MIAPGPATRIFLAPGATDLRRSFDGLHGLVQSQLAEDPQSGHLFLFCNKTRTRLKVLCSGSAPNGWSAVASPGRRRRPGARCG
jgi:transposase